MKESMKQLTMKGKLAAWLLSLCMAAGMAPVTTFAADTAYDLWVDGIQVTNANAADVLGEKDEGATVSYDAGTNTLTLDSANITEVHYTNSAEFEWLYGGIYSNLDGMKLNLVGENTVDVQEAANKDTTYNKYSGIAAGNMTIGGTGSLNVIGDDYGIFANKALTVDSGTVTAKGRIGISTPYGDSRILTVNGGTVTGEATVKEGTGIYVYDMTVTSGEVIGKSTASEGTGIVANGLIQVSGGKVTGTSGKIGRGISAGNMTVTGGEVTGTSTGDYRQGIYLNKDGNLTVSDGKVTGTSKGLETDGINAVNIEVSGGEVIGESNGVRSKGIQTYDREGGMTIKGGKVTGTSTTRENSFGVHVRTLQMTGGSLTGKGSEAAIVARSQFDTEGAAKAAKLIVLPKDCLPAEYTIYETSGDKDRSGECYAIAAIAPANGNASFEIDFKGKRDIYTNMVKDITLTVIPAEPTTPTESTEPTTPTEPTTSTESTEQTTPAITLQAPAAKLQVNAKDIKLTWDKVNNAQGYVIYKKTGSGKLTRLATVNGATKTSYTDKKVASGKKYSYQIKAFNGGTYSAYSKAVSTLYLAAQKPSVKKASGGIKITYKKIAGAKGYVIYRKAGKGKWAKLKTINKAKAGSYTDKKAKKGISYQYMIKAKSGSYYSAYMASKTIKR